MGFAAASRLDCAGCGCSIIPCGGRVGSELYQGIYCIGDAVGDEERVHVDRDDVRLRFGGARETDEYPAQRLAVDCGLASERSEDALRREPVDHVLGIAVGDRREPEHDVADGLGEHAADAEHHARAELRVGNQARDELAVATHHRGDEHLDRAVVGTGEREQIGGGRAYRVGVAQPEPHETPFGLVRDRGSAQLRDHGVAELVGRGGRAIGVGGGSLFEHGHAVTGEQPFRVGFGERRHRVAERSAVSTVVAAPPQRDTG